MNKITLSALLAVTLLSTNSFAAGGGNGQPFASLEALIAANTTEIENNAQIIADNAEAIATNTASISALNSTISVADLLLTSLESRISQNEADIAAANIAISGNTASINNLTIQISAAINQINVDIATLKSEVATLTGGLTTIQNEMDVKIAGLEAAIAGNSSDIATLSGIVTLMGTKIVSIQSDILGLLGRIGAAETTLTSHTAALEAIDSQLGTLGHRVTALESNSARTITFTGTSADDYAPGELKAAVASLNLTNEDWVYHQITSTDGTSEICSSNDEIVTTLNGMITSQWIFANNDNGDAGQTMVKGIGSSSWKVASSVYFYSLADFDGAYGTTVFDVNGKRADATLVENHDSGEFYANATWDNDGDTSITITAGTTRLTACGF